jgi:transcriptional regulator with XRE-family HTH domain
VVKSQSLNTNVGDLSSRLRKARELLGLSQEKMAKLGGVSLNTQNRYEGGTSPPVEYLIRIGQAGVDWYWIVTGLKAPVTPLEGESAELLSLFARLSPAMKQVALTQLGALLQVSERLQLGGASDASSSAAAGAQPAVHSPKKEFRPFEAD